MRSLRVLLLICLLPLGLCAQTGGSRVLNFLTLPTTAQSSALGGKLISARGNAMLAMSNPALLDSSMHKLAHMSYQPFFAGIGHTNLGYSTRLKGGGMWHASLQFFNYGDFTGFDATGQPTGGTFDAADFSFTIGHSRHSGPFRFGANLRFASSRIDIFTASALMADLGGAFYHPDKDFTIGLAVRNVGFLLSNYDEFIPREPLPLDVLLGMSFKPTYMPVRFHLTASNLQRSNLSFFDPSGTVDPLATEPGTVDEIFRRLNIGLELLFSENFQFRTGYNHLIRQELRLPQAAGGAGFAFGFMLRVSRFRMEFTRQTFHAVGGRSMLSLQTDLKGGFNQKEF